MSGIYIHIPFCRQACHYCNFHFSTSLKQKDELINALCKEIGLAPADKTETIDTVYFGGGTPSLLSIKELELIFSALNKKFSMSNNIEITLEANPDDINPEKLTQWKNTGISRLSVGIQSFVEDELKWMNRAHTAGDSVRCINEIQEAGFANFSVDLIYGSPLLDNNNWKKNVDIIIKKNIPHISCYALTVEPATALYKMIAQHKKAPVDAEKQAVQFLLLMDWMEASGYEHYEISNFAKPGMHSKHNSSYWKGKKYVGFGPSAHSFDGEKRKWNISSNAGYMQSIQKGIIPFEEETLTITQQINEYIMVSLRTMEGIDLDFLKKHFGKKCMDKLQAASVKWQIGKRIRQVDSKLILTRQGKLFADGIAADLFF